MKKLLPLLALVLFISVADAQLYPLFGPVTGVLKGNAASPQTSAAAAADVIGLWGGTCSSGTYLRGDGTCASVSGAGTVTSVALTMPTGFTVSGSPVTASGTLGVTTSLSGVLKASGGAFTTAAAADIYGLWSGTCSSSTYLNGAGACATPSGAGNVSTTGSPASGEIVAFSGATTITNGNISGDCTTTNTLAITCTKTSGTAFAASATTNTTNASNITSGTLGAAEMPALTGDCTTTVGTVATTCTKTSGVAFAPSATTDTTNAANISSGTLSAARGGTGEAGTITGVLKGNGTSAHTAAVAADIVGLFSTCSGTQYLGADGACHSGTGNVSTTGTPASGNLTRFTGASSISNGDLSGDCTTGGTLAVICLKTNGTSFGTLAVANAATPPALGGTTPAAGAFTTLSSAAPANTYGVVITGAGTSGQSFGEKINAGTTAADDALLVTDQTGAKPFLTLQGNGAGGVGYNAAGAGNPTITWSSAGSVGILNTQSGPSLSITNSTTTSAALQIQGNATTGSSRGIFLSAGSNTSDYAMNLNSVGGAEYFEVFGDGGAVVGSPTGGDKGVGTVNATALYINGVAVAAGSGEGVTAYGSVTSSCTMAQAKNMSCGSHTTGTGIYDMTVTGFSSVPFCHVSTQGPGFSNYAYGSSTSTTIVIATYNTSSANADEAFSVECFQ